MKRLLSWMLMMIMVLSLCACGDGGKNVAGEAGGGANAGVTGAGGENDSDQPGTGGQNGEDGTAEDAGNDTEEGNEEQTDAPEESVTFSDVLLKVNYELISPESGEVIMSKEFPYGYDAAGNTIAGMEYTYYTGSIGILELDFTYSYDENGVLIEAQQWSGSGENREVYEIRTYTYDEAGRLIQMKADRMSGAAIDITTYEYDADGNMIRKTFNGDRECTYTYENGLLIHTLIKSSNWGDLTETVDFTYNGAGQLTQRVYTEIYGDQYVTDFTYDGAGNCVSEITTMDKYGTIKRVWTEEYVYDAQGRILTRTIMLGDVSKSSRSVYTYTYGEYTTE